MTISSDLKTQADNQNAKSTTRTWGPRIGILASIIGSLLALISLFLPWAFGQSGFRVIIDMQGYSLSYSLIWLLPLITLGIGGIALLGMATSFWGRVAHRSNIIVAILILIFVVLACCPFSLFLSDHLFFMYTTPSKGLETLGIGFWAIGLSLVVSLVGSITAIVTSVLSRKTVPK